MNVDSQNTILIQRLLDQFKTVSSGIQLMKSFFEKINFTEIEMKCQTSNIQDVLQKENQDTIIPLINEFIGFHKKYLSMELNIEIQSEELIKTINYLKEHNNLLNQTIKDQAQHINILTDSINQIKHEKEDLAKQNDELNIKNVKEGDLINTLLNQLSTLKYCFDMLKKYVNKDQTNSDHPTNKSPDHENLLNKTISDFQKEKDSLDQEINNLHNYNASLEQTINEQTQQIKLLLDESNQIKQEKEDLSNENDRNLNIISTLLTEVNKLKESFNNLKPLIIHRPDKKETDKKDQNQTQKFKLFEILDEKEIKNLEIIEEIGYGKEGKVFKVAKKKNYALKVMKVNDCTEVDFHKFIEQYEIMNLFDHPSIVKTYGIFLSTKDSEPSILLEYCPINLSKAMRSKTLTNVNIICAIYQIVEGMKYLHFQKVIHRDLKPSNILIAEDGTVKIGDFGISKLMTVEEQSMTGGVGTQNYMAPEVMNKEKYDEKVDVYSFGVLLFFLLNDGKLPEFRIRDVCTGIMAQIPSSFTPFAKDLIESCWNFTPNKRPSFNQICDDLIKNDFKLLPLTEMEIGQVKEFVNKHQKLIPLKY